MPRSTPASPEATTARAARVDGDGAEAPAKSRSRAAPAAAKKAEAAKKAPAKATEATAKKAGERKAEGAKKPAAKKAPAKATEPAAKAPAKKAPAKKAAEKSPEAVKAPPAKKASESAKAAGAHKADADASRVVQAETPAPEATSPAPPAPPATPPRRGLGLLGQAQQPAPAVDASHLGDTAWLASQREMLDQERSVYTAQAEALKAEADAMVVDMEPGDIQFDEESGEGGTINVDRERDLALSAQARAAVEEIDAALAKLDSGTYGHCTNCGQPIARERLEAIPYAQLCVRCKSGGLSRR